MGGDGGSIPHRSCLIQTKKRAIRAIDIDPEYVLAKWRICSVSNQPLEAPVVACDLGNLFNKEALIGMLLHKSSRPPSLSHIKRSSDVFDVTLEFSGTKPGSFVCGVSGIEATGKTPFLVNRNCGCVVAERALLEVSTKDVCIVCGKGPCDMIKLYPQGNEDLDSARAAMELRKSSRPNKKRKKNKKE